MKKIVLLLMLLALSLQWKVSLYSQEGITEDTLWVKTYDYPQNANLCKISSNNDKIVCGTTDSLFVYKITTGEILWKKNRQLNSIDFSPSGEKFITTEDNGKISIWKSDSGTIQKEYSINNFSSKKAFYMSDSNKIFAYFEGGSDKKIAIINTLNDSIIDLGDYFFGYTLITYNKQRNIFAEGHTATDAFIRIWKFDTVQCLKASNISSPISDIQFSYDGKLLAASTDNGSIYIYNIDSLQLVDIIKPDSIETTIHCIKFTNDNKYIFLSKDEAQLKKYKILIYELSTHQTIKEYQSCRALSIDISDNSEYLAVAEEIDLACVNINLGKYQVPELFLENSLEVIPNPSNRDINLNLRLAKENNVEIAIIDLQGNILKTVYKDLLDVGYHSLKIDVSFLVTGTYLCNMKTHLVNKSVKFQISR